VAKNRPSQTTGKQQAGSAARQRARARLAAEQMAVKRAEARRRMLVMTAGITAVVAVFATLIVVKLSVGSPHPAASESAAPASLTRQVSTVPASVLAGMSGGQVATPLLKVQSAGPPLKVRGKPAIVFVSEESCPFCAAERWSLTVALSHFGTWSGLGITKSSATDVFPNTATLSFRNAHYTSPQLTLKTTELADNAGHPLQRQTPLDTQVISHYDVPPYVNSADQSVAVPFLDIANQYVVAGAQYDPQVLAGLSAAQIGAQLNNPSSPVAQAIDSSAQTIVNDINQVLHGQA
jgi:hypothetical protein